ncbi:MAG: peptidylprolyl isomerase, partial [Candidatus Margulisbacteria bacterium]|nr:peptidylprolyl isomerase [Candidatus Margulisiibacteriota bacterium]
KMALDGIIKQEKIPSEKELATALKQIGLTLPKFKQLVKDEIMVQKMVTKIKNEVTVGPNDLREIKASHILVTEEALAKELLVKLAKGASFAALAEQYSTDPGSKNKGGDLGYFSTGMMVAPFEKAAFALKVGEMSGVVQSSFGYHLITITDSRLRKFTGEEKDVEKAALAEKQAKVFRQWFSEIKEKAKVEIINPMLKAHDLRFKGRAFEAVQEYKKAIAQEPHNPYLHIFLGDTYSTSDKSELAIAEYEEAVKLEGGNPELHMLLAGVYENNKLKDKAVAQYKKASLVAGEDKALHEKLLAKFKELKAWAEVKDEQAEIKRIEKKEKFVEELNEAAPKD